MENAFNKAEELASAVKAYADARIDEVKLNLAEKSSAMVANLLGGIVVAIVFTGFIFFSSIALALVLGAATGKLWIGFLLVAVIYLLLGLVAWIAREKLIRLPLMNAMIRELFRPETDEEN